MKWRTDSPRPRLRFPRVQVTKTIPFIVQPGYLNRDFLVEKYVEAGWSLARVAKAAGCGKETVRERLVGFGVQLREPHQPHGHPSQPRFGQRVIKGQAIEHLAEAGVVSAIVELKAKGLTLREIAGTLSSMGIPTKCRGQRWHPMMVSRVLKARAGG